MGVKGLSESPTMIIGREPHAISHTVTARFSHIIGCAVMILTFNESIVMCTSGSIETLIPNQNILIHNLRRAAYIKRHR